MVRSILRLACGFVASCSTLIFSATVEANGRPNIVFIMSDDHAYQAVSAYDTRLTNTPNIDRIANEGVRFDRCYVTNSICGPSRACILTGQYSHKNGYFRNNDKFDPPFPTFPERLQEAGYQTALIGKWHLGEEPLVGFDHWAMLKHQGYYYQPKFISEDGRTQHVGYVTDVLTDYTLQWLKEKRDPDRPFALLMHHKAPHRPWDPALRYLAADREQPLPEPESLFDDYENRASAASEAKMRIAADMNTTGPDLKAWDQEKESGARDWFIGKLTVDQFAAWKPAMERRNRKFYSGDPMSEQEMVRWQYQRFLRDYVDCVAAVDDSVGEILDYLDESELAENTVVVYCSDQGSFLGEHGWFDKRFMYEQSLRTPFVVRWPAGINAGRVDERIVSNIDFAQTFLELAGMGSPPEMQGRSLVPIFKGAKLDDWRTAFYYHYYESGDHGHNVHKHEGVTDGRQKLIHYYELDEWELFDLESDPNELKNVYAEERFQASKTRLEGHLSRLKRELEVPDRASEKSEN